MRGRAATLSLAVCVGASAAAAVAPFLPHGLVLSGSACGGGGDEQRCIGIARRLSLVEISPRAWLYVAGGVLCLLLAGAAILALRRGRGAAIPIVCVLALVATVGLVSIEGVGAHVEPSRAQGTIGRLLEDWHPFLEPELADMRADALRKYEGRPTAPGGPVYDREQILDSFSVREQVGWTVVRWAIPAAFFAALLALAVLVAGSPALAVTLAGTAGLVAWALAYDRARPCDSNASECYDGIVTIFAVGVAVIWWVVYLVGTSVARRSDAKA